MCFTYYVNVFNVICLIYFGGKWLTIYRGSPNPFCTNLQNYDSTDNVTEFLSQNKEPFFLRLKGKYITFDGTETDKCQLTDSLLQQ